MPEPTPTKWWPLTRKVRNAAGASSGVILLAWAGCAEGSLSWRGALSASIGAIAPVAVAYLTGDETSP